MSKKDDAILHELETIELQLGAQAQTLKVLLQKLVETTEALQKIIPQEKEGFPEPGWPKIPHTPPTYQRRFWTDDINSIPEPCRGCPSHPNNGGSGFCLCILGCPPIT